MKVSSSTQVMLSSSSASCRIAFLRAALLRAWVVPLLAGFLSLRACGNPPEW
jgi:hypothetical protein